MVPKRQISNLFPFFLSFYEFCTNMSNDMYLPALGLIATDFQIGINQVQLTITAWLAGSMSVQLIVGPLADRYGRRPALLIGGVFFLLSSLGCALAADIYWLIFARFVQGISVCSMMVPGYASIHDLYDDEKAIQILVWMGTVAIIAPAIGPLFGGFILLFATWRWVFVALFALGVIALLGLFLVMPESATSYNRSSFNIKDLLGCYYRIISNHNFIISAISFALAYAGVIGWVTSSPVILMNYLNFTPFEFSLAQIPVFSSYIVGAQLIKFFVKNICKEKLIFFGLAIAGFAGLLLILFSYITPNHSLAYILPMTLYTFGFGFASAPLNRITLTATPERKGAAMAVFCLTLATSGTLISLLLSVLDETVFTASIVIALAIIGSFSFNKARKIS